MPVDLDETPLRASIARTCFISMENHKGKRYRGSGIILDWVVGGKPVRFVMTCGHNFAEHKNGVTYHMRNLTCYQLYTGDTYAEKYQVTRAYVHPCWDGNPGSGFDFAVGLLSAPMGG